MNIVGLSGDCIAATGRCTLIGPDSVKKCKGQDLDIWTSTIYFTLYALQNFHDWQLTMYDNIRYYGTKTATRSTEIVNDFTHTDVSDDGTTSNAALASAVMGMAGAIFGGSTLGIGAAATGLMGASIVSATQKSATDM